MIFSISAQRLRPARPLNTSTPPPTVPSTGLPLKNLVTDGSSHTVPIDDTTASARCSSSTVSAVGLLARISSKAARSCVWSSVGFSVWAFASVSFSHAG